MSGATWLDAIVLGLVQGLTEFLPISSSAHLRIVGAFLQSGGDPGAAFTAVTQLGTEAAVLIYFRKDIARIVHAVFARLLGRSADRTDARLGWLVAAGTVPIVAAGVAFKPLIETSLRNLYLTAAMLILFGLLLGLADRLGTRKRALALLTPAHGMLLGFAQALALVPGVSRSGGTISAALALGYTREAAARYSFLLAIPAVLASGLYQLHASWGDFGAISAGGTAIATLVAFVTGYGVIALFLRLIAVRSFQPFVVYRVVLGTVLLGLLLAGVLPAEA
jgi:undecaprenyl-diphosphatase